MQHTWAWVKFNRRLNQTSTWALFKKNYIEEVAKTCKSMFIQSGQRRVQRKKLFFIWTQKGWMCGDQIFRYYLAVGQRDLEQHSQKPAHTKLPVLCVICFSPTHTAVSARCTQYFSPRSECLHPFTDFFLCFLLSIILRGVLQHGSLWLILAWSKGCPSLKTKKTIFLFPDIWNAF